MAYFAWHKLASRRVTFTFPIGCTTACCCPAYIPNTGIVCEEDDPNQCANPFVGCCKPYPISWPDTLCCWGEEQSSWCPPVQYNGGFVPGACYFVDQDYIGLCFPWIGQIDEKGNTTWIKYDPQTFNCSGEQFECNDTQQGPLTTRITVGTDTKGGTSAFFVARPNKADYYDMRYVDPAFSWERPPRYYRTPKQPSSLPTKIHETPICLRLKIPSEVPTRTMVLSGYNKYKYTGYLTNDGAVYDNFPIGSGSYQYSIPKIVNAPGASGLSQMEGSLGRSFPASDDVLTFPLWGATASYISSNLENCGTNNCLGQVFDYISGTADNFCIGDDCIQVQENDATGHYMTMQSLNFTGHYHSFSGFNPYVKFWEGSTGYIGYDENGENSAYNNGTGLPTCSLYSLAWALYDRSWRAVADAIVSNGGTNDTESELTTAYSSFGDVRSRLSSLLGDDPRNLTGSHGESVVSYWFRELNEKIETFHNTVRTAESLESYIPELGTTLYEYGAFTTPKVILWDKTSFKNAATNADRWKSLYIPGSGNILFDSGCVHTNNNWKAYKFFLDEATHDMAWGSTHAARIVQFRVCDASDDQILANTCISMTEALYDYGNFCTFCATASAPFNMSEADCVTGPRPEIWGDSTVGTDYTPSGGGGGGPG